MSEDKRQRLAVHASFTNIAEARIKHLELIQGVINRLAGNSFAIKGWCLTLVAAVIGLSSKDSNAGFAAVAFIPSVFFWGIDGYFLRQERLYRKLYDEVRVMTDDDWKSEAFSMQTNEKPVTGPKSNLLLTAEQVEEWLSITLSPTLRYFYAPVIVVIIGIVIWHYYSQVGSLAR